MKTYLIAIAFITLHPLPSFSQSLVISGGGIFAKMDLIKDDLPPVFFNDLNSSKSLWGVSLGVDKNLKALFVNRIGIRFLVSQKNLHNSKSEVIVVQSSSMPHVFALESKFNLYIFDVLVKHKSQLNQLFDFNVGPFIGYGFYDSNFRLYQTDTTVEEFKRSLTCGIMCELVFKLSKAVYLKSEFDYRYFKPKVTVRGNFFKFDQGDPQGDQIKGDQLNFAKSFSGVYFGLALQLPIQ